MITTSFTSSFFISFSSCVYGGWGGGEVPFAFIEIYRIIIYDSAQDLGGGEGGEVPFVFI